MSKKKSPSGDSQPLKSQEKISFLQKVVDLSPNLLFVIDVNSHRIVYVNSRVKDLLGFDAEFVIEQGSEIFKSVLHPEDYQRRLDNFQKCIQLEQNEECEVEVRFRTPTNDWEWFKIKDKVFDRDKDGKVTHIVGTAIKIYEQKIWEALQKEEHRRFLNAQEIAHIGSFERKLPGDQFHYSPEFYNILGLKPKKEAISFEEFLSHVHPDDRSAYLQAIKHTHATGEPLDMITRAIKPDGIVRFIHRRAAVLKDQQGVPVKIYGTAQDITDRVQAETERKKLDNLMRSTELLAGIGSYEVNLHTNKVYFSDGMFRLFGYEPGEFEPEQEWVDQHSHPEDAIKVQQVLEEAVKNKSDYSYTRRIYRKDGETRLLEALGSIVVDEHGNPSKFYGLVQDVTERKKAEEKLRKSEEGARNLLNVLQNAPDAYLVLTPDWYIELASDAYLEATNTRREEIIGRPLFEVFPDNPALPSATGEKNLRASFQTVLSTKKPHRMPIQHYDVRRHDGTFEEKYWSPTNSPVVNAEGEVEYIIHRVLDITDVVKKQTAVKGLENETEMLKTSLEEIKIQADQIQKSRMLLQSIFDASPNSIVLFDILCNKEGKAEDFRFAMLNAFNFEQLGFSHHLVGKRLLKEFPKVERLGVLEQLKNTADTGIQADFETLYEGDGLNHYFRFRANKVEDRLVLTSEDITDRKKSEETIHQMLHGSNSGISILEAVRNKEGKIEDFLFKGVNKAAERISKLNREEMEGKRLFELFPGAKELFFEQYKKVLETGEPLNMQRYYPYEDLNIWLDVSAVKNGDGFIMTFHDITEQKNAEEELFRLKEEMSKRAHESEYRFASLVTASSDTVYKMSADWETMHHLQGKNFLSDTAGANNSWLKDYIPKPERPRMLKAIREAIKDKRMFELEHQVFDINGNIGWTYSRAIPNLNANGEIVEWLGVASNITPRKKAERRQSFLLKLSDTLRSLTEPEKILDYALKNLGQHLQVNRAYYSEALPDGDTLNIRSSYLKDIPPMPERIKLSDLDAGIQKLYLQGRILVFNDSLKDLEPNEAMEKARMETKIRAGIGVPLVKDEKLLAVVGVHQSRPRIWATEDVALVEEVCERTWAAVERARAEKALREAQESLNIALEAAQMGAWFLNMVNGTSKRNFRHDQIFGYKTPQTEWNHNIARKHILEEDRVIFDNAFDNALKTGELQFEARVRWQDGSIHWIAVSGHFFFDENGKPIRAAGVNFEVTERRQAEQALRESEQRFRDLVESSAVAVWETNAEGLVVQDSPSWRAFTGQTYKEWLGTGWANAVHPQDRENAAKAWKTAIESREKIDIEFRLINKNGEYRWINVKATPILDYEGKVKKWSGMNLDIHNRKLTEEALIKAKEEAEAASRAKEDFVSTMSHEIRTPLNAVIGLTNLLLENNPREDQKENLNSLSFSAENLLSLINDILDFSKLEAGKGDIEQNEFNLSNLIISLQQLYKPQARNNGTDLILQLDENIPEYIVSDQLKLSQILHNLVSNAVKFTKEGYIKFSISSGKKEEEVLWLDFSIEDTGIGVPEEKLARIFEKFSQAESSTVRQYGGTGLGLTITKLLLELLGSEIKVESHEGKGSKFYFSLPVKEVKSPKREQETVFQQEEFKDLSHISLLLVEDVEINRNILIQFFQNWWNLKPEEAVNGQEAVTMAQQNVYDFILMDIRMPIMDGYEATRIIREIEGYKNVPILALTADKNQEVQQVQHATQFDDLLTKPFDPARLKKTILHHLKLSVEQNSSGGEPEDILTTNLETKVGKEEESNSFSLKKYKSLARENSEVLQKLVNNSLKAIKAYKEEFATAATDINLEGVSNLIHKNTINLHYIEAKKLEQLISDYREYLKSKQDQTLEKQKANEILAEFDAVISGLEKFLYKI